MTDNNFQIKLATKILEDGSVSAYLYNNNDFKEFMKINYEDTSNTNFSSSHGT